MLHLLRSSPCINNPGLIMFDNVLRKGLSNITNVSLSDSQWLQASWPVRNGGLGIRRTEFLAASAFLGACYATLPLQEAIYSLTSEQSP
jgi:hypothetical protein